MQHDEPSDNGGVPKRPRAKRSVDIKSGNEPQAAAAGAKDPIKPRAKVVLNAPQQDTEEQRQLKEALRAKNDEVKRANDERKAAHEREKVAPKPPPINDPIYEAKMRKAAELRRKMEDAEERAVAAKRAKFELTPDRAFYLGVGVGVVGTLLSQRLLGGSGTKAPSAHSLREIAEEAASAAE